MFTPLLYLQSSHYRCDIVHLTYILLRLCNPQSPKTIISLAFSNSSATYFDVTFMIHSPPTPTIPHHDHKLPPEHRMVSKTITKTLIITTLHLINNHSSIHHFIRLYFLLLLVHTLTSHHFSSRAAASESSQQTRPYPWC